MVIRQGCVPGSMAVASPRRCTRSFATWNHNLTSYYARLQLGIPELVPHPLSAILDYWFHGSYYAFGIDAIYHNNGIRFYADPLEF
ncbi:hypothetical protein TSUD_180370 [Trifolium subterraneum]|uniref:Uncharacterized protein n=1 Tax=Trifolium subterraneum TaxID=3900 RepID=A0A2Z6PRK6_TRISU|nr:hypothetical protein TSUD_180370 [Trifolium subterraneum]